MSTVSILNVNLHILYVLEIFSSDLFYFTYSVFVI